MWFVFALISAVFYSALWVLARMSRGIPSSVVTASQFIVGPFLLIGVSQTVDYPWSETWWQWYLLLPLFFLPVTLWAMTYALHRTEVTVVKPLFGLSSIATLFVSSFFFGESTTALGIFGIAVITFGLLFLYHGRWQMWKHRGPWIVLASAIVFGINGACVSVVLSRFPHIFAISALMMTGAFVLSGLGAGKTWFTVRWTSRNITILIALIIAMIAQDIITLYAFTLGPAAYVVAVKRTSILMTAVIGYVFLRERDQSLPRLMIASGLVVAGVVMLTVG
jgi:drug/metabolite transporter (DMT)-like permease